MPDSRKRYCHRGSVFCHPKASHRWRLSCRTGSRGRFPGSFRGAAPCALFRLWAIVCARWWRFHVAEQNEFSLFSRQVFGIIEWLPLRATDSAFARLGNSGVAVHIRWIPPAQWPDRDPGIVLAGEAGAVGIPMGRPVVDDGEISGWDPPGPGDSGCRFDAACCVSRLASHGTLGSVALFVGACQPGRLKPFS